MVIKMKTWLNYLDWMAMINVNDIGLQPLWWTDNVKGSN